MFFEGLLLDEINRRFVGLQSGFAFFVIDYAIIFYAELANENGQGQALENRVVRITQKVRNRM
jgi:hypothetical protein